jgi:hypothetical protein
MRICTNCRGAYSRDNTFCPFCRMSHHSIGRVCPRGHSNPRDAIFCATCGSYELSQMAPPPPILRRIFLPAFIIGGIVLVVWFLVSVVVPHSAGIFSVVFMWAMDLLLPVFALILVFFAITLLLPKHIGKYLRKVMFTLGRYSFRLIGLGLMTCWRLLAYLASYILARRNPDHRRHTSNNRR